VVGSCGAAWTGAGVHPSLFELGVTPGSLAGSCRAGCTPACFFRIVSGVQGLYIPAPARFAQLLHFLSYSCKLARLRLRRLYLRGKRGLEVDADRSRLLPGSDGLWDSADTMALPRLGCVSLHYYQCHAKNDGAYENNTPRQHGCCSAYVALLANSALYV